VLLGNINAHQAHGTKIIMLTVDHQSVAEQTLYDKLLKRNNIFITPKVVGDPEI
jgi:hypothetical protein